MNDEEIRRYAVAAANELPSLDPEAERLRRAFRVSEAWREGAQYVGVRVDVDDAEYLSRFERPGQYVTFGYGPLDPRFLVIANAPSADDARWEFLIDIESDLGDATADISRGDRVILSPPEGSGYPIGTVAGRHILMFTTGSGIASMRPVIQYWSEARETAPRSMSLYYGEVSSDDFAYVGEYPDWRDAGVRLFRAIEDTPHPEEGYRYVQHAFEDHDPDLEEAFVFVSGAPLMMEIIIAKLVGLGVAPERIFTNI